MPLAEWERTTDTTTTQFVHFIAFIAENGLTEETIKRLNEAGLDRIRVSVQHIRVIQEMIRQQFQEKDLQRLML